MLGAGAEGEVLACFQRGVGGNGQQSVNVTEVLT